MSKVFVLGAGFSAHQGLPLVRDLRHEIEDFLKSDTEPLVKGLSQQYWEATKEIDPCGSMEFEELFRGMLHRLSPQDGAVAGLRMAAARFFWRKHEQTALRGCYHNFARWFLGSPSARRAVGVVTFNWDVVVESALESLPGGSWSYNFGDGRVPVIKPHGSINWNRCLRDGLRSEYPSWTPIGQHSQLSYDVANPLVNPDVDNINPDLTYMLFPGDPDLPLQDRDLEFLWQETKRLIERSDTVVFIGYSLPSYDSYASDFFKEAVGTRDVEVYSPSKEARGRYQNLFGTRVKISLPEKFEDCVYSRPPDGERLLIDVSKDKIAQFCENHHIRKLSLFGSVLRDDFRPESDVDVLVEFEPGHTVGLIRMAGLELELSELLGRKVDLRTLGDLSRYFRDEVARSSEVQFVKG